MKKFTLIVTSAILIPTCSFAADWKPADGPLMTRWAKDVSPKNPLPEYPRPQMVRKDWQNLNGLWDYAITGKDAPPPTQRNERTVGVVAGLEVHEARSTPLWDGQILVPFAIESALSGVMKMVGETNRLWYRRTFTIPRGWKNKNVLLHFGAVDWETKVWVNGKELGSHRGGYDGFSFDITSALKASGENEIIVSVFDPSDAGTQPRGKQVRKPNGIWYTPTSGIWQTVWIEPVSDEHIATIKIIPNVDSSNVVIQTSFTTTTNRNSVQVRAEVLEGNSVLDSEGHAFYSTVFLTSPETGSGAKFQIKIPRPKLWSPESPFLYGLQLKLYENDKVVDEVKSYFAMRKISLGKDEKGFTRILLNNKPYFQFGPLDQGFWPDGIYTAPTDEALRYDIEMTKKLGFNMARKHVKVEPERWYYWCDKLGLLVWQDLPSGDKYIRPTDPDITRTPESAKIYETELKAMIDGRGNHPCIVTWVPFNEGWGQFDTARITVLVKKWDPSRLVINTSGWSDRGVGDINDMHKYPGPASPEPEEKRAIVLGEFGGLGLPIKGHTWQNEKNWGYKSFTNAESLTTAYVGLVEQLPGLTESKGLSAAVYTQTTDVEVEVNGLMTYDRAMVKMNPATVSNANKKVYGATSKDGAVRKK